MPYHGAKTGCHLHVQRSNIVYRSTVLSLPASDIFCRLLIIFANSLYPDLARRYVGPGLGTNCLTF